MNTFKTSIDEKQPFLTLLLPAGRALAVGRLRLAVDPIRGFMLWSGELGIWQVVHIARFSLAYPAALQVSKAIQYLLKARSLFRKTATFLLVLLSGQRRWCVLGYELGHAARAIAHRFFLLCWAV